MSKGPVRPPLLGDLESAVMNHLWAGGDGEAKAGTALSALRTLEALEYPLLVFGIDARTLVGHMGAGKAVGTIEGNRHRSALRRVAHGIADRCWITFRASDDEDRAGPSPTRARR